MSTGVYVPGGALNVTLNDTTTKGAYMPDGSLRVTDVAGAGLYDASGALRVTSSAAAGVYATRADQIRYSNASADGKTGVYFSDGSIRMTAFDPIVARYQAVSGVSNATAQRLNIFILEGKSSGWLTGSELYPYRGPSLTSALVPLQRVDGSLTPLTNTGFVPADYSELSGFGNATVNASKFLGTGVTFDGLGLTYTNFAFGQFVISTASNASGYLLSDFHGAAAGDSTIYIGPQDQGATKNTKQSASGSNARLVSADTSHFYNMNAGLLQDQSIATPMTSFTSATEIELFRRTINGNAFYTFGKSGMVRIGPYMTEAQGLSFTRALYALEQDRALPSVKPGVYLGDSIIYGTGATNSSTCWARLVSVARNKTELNFGVPSAKTTGVAIGAAGWAVSLINRYTAIAPLAVDVVLVMSGSNDCSADASTNGNPTLVATYQTALTTILSDLASWYGAGVIYAVSPQWNQTKNSTFNGLWNAGMAAAASAAGVGFIDYYSLLMAQTTPADFCMDDFHPNNTSQSSTLGTVLGGHGLIAALVLSIVP